MQWQEPPAIDLDPTIDAHVFGSVTTIQFGIAIMTYIPGFILSSIFPGTLFIHVLIAFLFPLGSLFYYYKDGPRVLAIFKSYHRRKRQASPGDTLIGGYDLENFKTMNPLLVVKDYVLVFAKITLQPVALMGLDTEVRLHLALERMTRAVVKADVKCDWFFSHELYRPTVTEESDRFLQARNKYWMETGAGRFVTQIIIRLAVKTQDLDIAWKQAEKVKMGYESAGGEGWDWASGQLAGQMAFDELDPGAAWRRYVAQFKSISAKHSGEGMT